MQRLIENQRLLTRKWYGFNFLLVTITLFSLAACSPVVSEDLTFCEATLYLIEQSETHFESIREEANSDHGGFEAAFTLPEADYCTILPDAEKTSYQCSWVYPLGAETAATKYQSLLEETRLCLGNIATEKADQPVNHPDTYLSSYFQLLERRSSEHFA